MKEFFKFMFASMVGFILTVIILSVIFIVIIIAVISFSTSTEITISPKTVMIIKLDKPVMDRSPKNPFFVNLGSNNKISGLNDILDNIKKAETDPDIKGIYLDISVIPSGFSTIDEIREALINFKKSGKFVISYSEAFTQTAYYLSTVSDKIYLNPQGILLFKGLNAEMTFLKGTLDKLDIKVQVIRHGKYKAATEPLFLDKMSPENRQQISALISGIWNRIITGVSETRNLPVEELNRLADSLKIETPEDALKYKLVDRLAYKDELIAELKKLLETPEKKDINSITIEKYSNVPEHGRTRSEKDGKIAVIYALGNISGGEGDDQTIGSERLSKAIRKARGDEKVKAVVFRINSPGGGSLASDVIWREVALTAKVKPVVASFGNVAASGGYYIACPSTKILADPGTITGSIGVFGVIPNFKDFFNKKLGITFDNESTNKNSDFISVTKPLPPFQEKILQNEIERIYDAFISHVAEGRHLSKEKVDSIGQGRVWGGTDAIKIGLIDEFGGLEKAISKAAELAKIKNYKIIELPEQKDPFQQLYEELMGDSRVSVLEKELGENYKYFQYLKEMHDMKGIQMLMPYLITLN